MACDWDTCWENRQLLTRLIHDWVTALLVFTWSPQRASFDRLLNKGCLKFLFNISKTLIQRDISTGVLHVTKSAAVEIHSLQHEMFVQVLLFFSFFFFPSFSWGFQGKVDIMCSFRPVPNSPPSLLALPPQPQASENSLQCRWLKLAWIEPLCTSYRPDNLSTRRLIRKPQPL